DWQGQKGVAQRAPCRVYTPCDQQARRQHGPQPAFNLCDGGQGKVGPRPKIGIAREGLSGHLALLACSEASRHCPPPEGVISETLFIKERSLGAYLDTNALCGRPPPGNHIGLPLRRLQRFLALSSRRSEFFCC